MATKLEGGWGTKKLTFLLPPFLYSETQHRNGQDFLDIQYFNLFLLLQTFTYYYILCREKNNNILQPTDVITVITIISRPFVVSISFFLSPPNPVNNFLETQHRLVNIVCPKSLVYFTKIV